MKGMMAKPVPMVDAMVVLGIFLQLFPGYIPQELIAEVDSVFKEPNVISRPERKFFEIEFVLRADVDRDLTMINSV